MYVYNCYICKLLIRMTSEYVHKWDPYVKGYYGQ